MYQIVKKDDEKIIVLKDKYTDTNFLGNYIKIDR